MSDDENTVDQGTLTEEEKKGIEEYVLELQGNEGDSYLSDHYLVMAWGYVSSLQRRNLDLAKERLAIERGVQGLAQAAWDQGYETHRRGDQKHNPFAPQ